MLRKTTTWLIPGFILITALFFSPYPSAYGYSLSFSAAEENLSMKETRAWLQWGMNPKFQEYQLSLSEHVFLKFHTPEQYFGLSWNFVQDENTNVLYESDFLASNIHSAAGSAGSFTNITYNKTVAAAQKLASVSEPIAPPVSEPMLEPAPAVTPVPEPEPKPVVVPDPEPLLAPDPEPVPEEPAASVSEPITRPSPFPNHEPKPWALNDPAPDPEPEPTSTPIQIPDPKGTACSDGIDNDGDGRIDYGHHNASDPDCTSAFDHTEYEEKLTEISWQDFPEFQLPKNFITWFGGIPRGSHPSAPLSKGFSHVDRQSHPVALGDAALPSERALLWTGIAGNYGNILQPWQEQKSPWGNNMGLYHRKWISYMNAYANSYSDTAGTGLSNADIIMIDVESFRRENEILSLREEESVPDDIKALDDESFIDQYKRDIAALYYAPMKFIRELSFKGKITSYADVPIRRTWYDIPQHSWKEWSSNRDLVHYTMNDFNLPGEDFYSHYGPFYYDQDFMTVSAYYFYDYPVEMGKLDRNAHKPKWNRAGQYLAYLLFQIEANRAWIPDKDIIVALWLRFHDGGSAIRPHMAHATAIFTFFSGAQGFYQYATTSMPMSDLEKEKLVASNDQFIYGLYRLSQYNDFFEGNYTVYARDNARDLFVGCKPVWRGILHENGAQMLVAAHNPYAMPDEDTEIPIYFKDQFLATITVKGLDTYLGVLDICGGNNDCDHDGILNTIDNCLNIANADQKDLDLNGTGDACEPPPVLDEFADHIIGNWNFDQDHSLTAFDSSQQRNDGVYTGDAHPGPGFSGNGLVIDGDNDYINLGDILDLGTSDRTIALWLKGTDATGTLISKGHSSTSNQHDIQIRDEKPYCLIDINQLHQDRIVRYTNTKLNDGQWHHYATVIDRDKRVTIYVDGFVVGFKEISQDAEVNAQNSFPLIIGAERDGSYGFDGVIDEVLILDTALNEEQVQRLYQNSLPADTSVKNTGAAL